MDTESQLSPMAEVVIPSTPPPQPLRSSNTSEMTPPPSTQPPRTLYSAVRPKSAHDPFQSPTPAKVGTASLSSEKISKATVEELRAMVQDLIQQLNEAHLSAAHFQLQHHLLSLDSQESAQRAEIEHQMSRREVEFLQASERRRSAQPSTPRISQSPSQPQIDSLLKTCRTLEAEKQEDKRRLRKAKRVIEVEMGKTEALFEENCMLKQRIQDNREHFNQFMQSSSFPTPRADFATPRRSTRDQRNRLGRDQDPFAALLAADQVLSGEAASVPSTPTRAKPPKYRTSHTRGAFSLSSLHTTPNQPSEHTYLRLDDRSAPNSAAKHERDRLRRRDSTISVSDEEVLTDQDLPQSQASSLAASMLRRSQESAGPSGSAKAEKSSKLLQSKLFGQVKKAGTGKRKGSFEGEASKKAKLGEGVGLGLGMGIGGVGGRGWR